MFTILDPGFWWLFSNIEHTHNNILIIIINYCGCTSCFWLCTVRGKHHTWSVPFRVWQGRTSAGIDDCVKSIPVALGRFQTLDSADQRNHPQTVERCVKDGRHEFTLQKKKQWWKASVTQGWLLIQVLSQIKCLCVSHLAIGGLNNSLRSVKLDRNRVRGVSMGSSRMMDEFDVTLFTSLFRDAAKSTLKGHVVYKVMQSQYNLLIYSSQTTTLNLKHDLKKDFLPLLYAFTWWQILSEDDCSFCSVISGVVRVFQCSNGQRTMWGWGEERIGLLAFFDGEPHNFYPAI